MRKINAFYNLAADNLFYMFMKGFLYPIFGILITALLSCNSDMKQSESNNDTVSIVVDSSENLIAAEKFFNFEQINNVADFLTGKGCNDCSEFCKSDFYTAYTASVKTQWDELNKKTLYSAVEWSKNNISDFVNDTASLFYPFGGPDILFARTFFPKARTYILFGLENPGRLPDFEKFSEDQLKQYAQGMEFSFRYINRFGFFVAEHMRDDFNNKYFDGTIHPVVYALAINGCQIESYRPVSLSKNGTLSDPSPQSAKSINGYELKFMSDGLLRTLYYFRLDASDPPMTQHLEFAYFINKFGNLNCYIKSASYLLQENAFSIMRNIIFDNCKNILQDESGIAYSEVKKHYQTELYGTYQRPVKVFSMFPQNDLRIALEKGSKPLPFKIGYTSQFNNSIMMVCRKESPEAFSQNTASSDTVYKVQFKVSWNKLAENEPIFNGIPEVDFYTDGSYYKYTAGCKKSQAECSDILKLLVKKGYSDAFVVIFSKGKRIK